MCGQAARNDGGEGGHREAGRAVRFLLRACRNRRSVFERAGRRLCNDVQTATGISLFSEVSRCGLTFGPVQLHIKYIELLVQL